MKRRALCFFLLLSVFSSLVFRFSTSTVSASDENTLMANRLINPGFESGSSYWTLGWNWSISSESSETDSYSLKCAGTGGWSNTYQTIAVQENTDYILSFWGKNSYSTVYKVTGIDSQTNLTGDLRTNDLNIWTRYDVRFNSGSNASVKIFFADGGGTHYFDDMNLFSEG